MKDSFIIEGKKYISARRASEISDYAPDYVGQLCRANKLDCRMIGRSWFVTEESIHLHKAAISREEASRSRIENLRGKSVARIVDQVSTSTSSVPSTSSIPSTSTVLSLNSQSPSVVSNTSPLLLASAKNSTEQKVVVKNVIPSPWTIEASIKSPFVYTNDDRPLLPILNKKVSTVTNLDSKIVNDKNQANTNEKLLAEIKSPIVVSSEKKIISESPVVVLVKIPVVSPVGNPVISPLAKIAKSSVTQKSKSPKSDSESKPAKSVSDEKLTSSISRTYGLKSLVTYSELTRDLILKRVIAPVFAFAILFSLATGTYIVAEKVGNSSTAVQFASSIYASGANVSDAFARAYSGLRSGYKSVVSFFTSPAKLAMDVPKEFGDVTVNAVTPNGIVLTSSTGSDVADDEMKQKIRDSFSDDVTISSDSSGTAGVITPVFKDTKGKDFIYVMVPVKDKDNNETK